MHGINLHAVVRNAINTINPDEIITLYRAAGQVNIDGLVTAKYEPGVEMAAQWQPNDEKALTHTEKLSTTRDSEQIFLYSDAENPVVGLSRLPIARSGDMIQRGKQWYLVTSILEDWSRVSWINVEVTLQTKPPDFSASEWGEGEPNGS